MSLLLARNMTDARNRIERIEAADRQKRLTAAILSLPYLRAVWTMGAVDYQNPQVQDATGNGYALTNNNTSLFGDNLSAPYAEFDGVNQYLSRADGGAGNWADIVGTELYIPAGQRGLTFGGWFQLDRLTLAEFLIAKGTNVAATESYSLRFRGDVANDPFQFSISNGLAITSITHTSSTTVTTGRWYYVVGRFDPGNEIRLFLGNGSALESTALAVGIPAALNDSATAFTIGASGVPGNYLDGKASCCFLCAGLLTDSWVKCLYSQLRSIFRI